MIKKIWNKIFGKPKEEISFRQGFDLAEVPVVTLRQGDKKLNFLLDTGANDSIIDKNIIDQLEFKPLNATSNMVGVEGNQKEVAICEITIAYKDQEYTYEYLICDMSKVFGHIKQDTGVTLHGLLGSKFFNKFKYVLDFDSLIAYSKYK